MADAETEATEETEQEETEQVTPEDVKAIKAALHKANKEAEKARLRVKEFEDRDKSETDRAAEKVTAAEQRAAKAELDVLRLKVATSKGLTPDLADRLRGDDEDELKADADRLVEMFGKKSPPKVPTGPRGGGGEPDMNALIRERMRR